MNMPICLWFTGLSGAGKTTLLTHLHKRLSAEGYQACVLDGDHLRTGLCVDLGYSVSDRAENIRRAGEVAKLMVDAGLIVLVGLISPFIEERNKVRSRFKPGQFIEVFVDTPLDECERRDVKGLYAKARAGLVRDFTGVTSPYESPLSPDVHIKTLDGSLEDHVELLFYMLKSRQ